MEKKDKLKKLIDALHNGMSQEEAREIFKREFGQISGAELSEAENQLVAEGMPVSEIQKLCDVHASVFEDGIVFMQKPLKGYLPLEETPGHPAFVFKKENEGIENFLQTNFLPALEAFKSSDNTNDLAVASKSLSKISEHYKRKENLFFPLLEREGVTAPPKVMWGVDDEIRESIQKLNEMIESGSKDSIIELASKVIDDVRSMISKEDNILMPMMLEKFTAEDWLLIAHDSGEIGYIFTGGIEGASPSDAVTWYQAQTGNHVNAIPETEGEIRLPSGFFSSKELETLLNTLPGDITFVGADDKVHYFSEGKSRVFPRTRSIIGRDVENCHPPKSLHVVEALVDDFKSGKKDEESFWIQKGGLFILIRYYAVRDEEGTYLGVVEVTEEISNLRSLEGSKTLLSD